MVSAVTVKLTMDCPDCGVSYFQELATPDHPGHWDKRGRLQLPAAVTDHECQSCPDCGSEGHRAGMCPTPDWSVSSAAAVPEAQDGREALAQQIEALRAWQTPGYQDFNDGLDAAAALIRSWPAPSLAAPEGTEQ